MPPNPTDLQAASSSPAEAEHPRSVNQRQRFTWLSTLVAIATVVGTVVALITLYLAAGPNKTLELRSISSLFLVAPDASGIPGFAISVNGASVKQPFQWTGDLVAGGREPIRASDIEQPVEIAFGAARVLSTSATAIQPIQLPGIRAESSENSVRIVHGLMNPGDRIRISVILDGRPLAISTSGRIAGVSAIPLSDQQPDHAPYSTDRSPNQARLQVSIFLIIFFGGFATSLLVFSTNKFIDYLFALEYFRNNLSSALLAALIWTFMMFAIAIAYWYTAPRLI
jgi:hypothetical protein